jgi:LmbE family N-acetylglucosaminyl deacetylase
MGSSEGHERVLLAIFAHPDDESFGPGGTLAKYAREGVKVWYACGTDGNAGTVDAEMLEGYKSTSQLRAAELCCAAQTLGLAGIDWLAYRDSGMRGAPENDHPDSLFQAPLEKVVGQLVASIRKHRPQVILCDNQYGGYGHPDHIKLHQATMIAFAAAGDAAQFPEHGPAWQPQKLYHPAFGFGLFRWLVRIAPLAGRDPKKFGRNGDIDLTEVLTWELPSHARIDVSQYLQIKEAASACHRSQGGPMQMTQRLPPAFRRRIFRYEGFTQAIPAPEPRARKSSDLFEGCV